ncbi:MAG: ElyC/SanA/YdcF family protein [Candidatus Sulfotelmatobacter sp.]
MGLAGKRRIWMAAGLVLAVLWAFFAARAGRFLVVDAPRPSDVIVVLAGETDRRPARALELLQQGYGKRVLIDVPAESNIYTFTQLDLARKYVQSLPEAAAVSVCPIVGLSTKAETQDVEKCLTRMNAGTVLIVTSEFHTRRALSIFRRELRGRTFSVAAAYDSAQFGTRWWTHRQWAKTVVDEWLRLLWWNVVDRWH